LKFNASTIQEYAQQLSHHRIELSAIGGAVAGVDYVIDVAGRPRSRHNPDSASEGRLYFRLVDRGPLDQWDKQLLNRAGISLKDRIVLKFVDPALEDFLARIELDYALAHDRDTIDGVVKTVFRSERTGSGYQFVVVDQRYR